MLKATTLAHISTAVMASLYIVCAVVTIAFPDFLYTIISSWAIVLGIGIIHPLSPMSFGMLLVGIISISVATWITAFLSVALYNYYLEEGREIRRPRHIIHALR